MNIEILLSLLFSGVVAISTVVYAVLTWKLTSETRLLREASSNPKVSIGIKTDDWWLNLNYIFVKNEGMGPAYDIKFALNVDKDACNERIYHGINKLSFLSKGIDYLSAGCEISSYIFDESGIELTDLDVVVVYIEYKNAFNKVMNDKYILDFTVFNGISRVGEPEMSRIARSIENIEKILNKYMAVVTKNK
jgi:hypothetical protein